MLDTCYKLYARILQNRIAHKVDAHLRKTQYGFRKGRSTVDALFILRRILEWVQNQKDGEFYMLFSDWKMAFDKVDHKALLIALKRMGFSQQYVNIIQDIYSNPQFYVSDDQGSSSKHRQNCGVRQGCPLSPYLFSIALHVIFYDF